MKVNLDLKENKINILNEDVDDFICDFDIYGDDEWLYGLKNDVMEKKRGRWHRPNKVFFCYKKIKFKMTIKKNRK